MGLLSGIVNLGSNLFHAAGTSIGTALQDQWKEYFYCDSLPNDVLMVKGQKRISSRSANTKGSDNIISNGSGIVVNDGQCMIIVDQGAVVEICAEPGKYTYDSSTSPSIFAGKLGKSIVDTFKEMWNRFTYGGDTGKDQRVYYFNLKEILDNKFGTQSPIMFKIVDSKIALDIDVGVRCSGVYSFKIVNPIVFYANVAGNVVDEYKKDELASAMKTEFVQALQPALAQISRLEVRPSDLPGYVKEISDAVNQELSVDWGERRGIECVKVSLNPITLSEEDQKRITDAQAEARYRDAGLAGAGLTAAQIEAMKTAAGNENGAIMGFAGLNMATQTGGINANTLYQMAGQQQAAAAAADSWVCPNCGKTASGKFCQECGTKKPEPAAADAWTCPKCGKTATGKFCQECGEKKPEAAPEGWNCPKCGTVNKGKFCRECGEKKPADAPLYKCDQCGWEPEDPKNPPKFCPQCGDRFDENDIV